MRIRSSRLARAGHPRALGHILLLAVILVLSAPESAQADYSGDCYQLNDLDLTIRGCALVLNNVTLAPKERSNAADWRCWAYFLKRDYDRALADCNKAIELNSQYFEAFRDRCLVHARKGQPDLAINDCNKALELHPDDAIALDHRCWSYYNKGDYDRALADCTKAIELKQDFESAYVDRCFVYNAKDQYDLAIRDCGKAIELKTTNGYAYWDRGYALQKKENYAAALADLKKAEALLSQSDAGEQSRLRGLIREVEAALAAAPQPETSATTGSVQTAPEQQDLSLGRDERRAIQQRLKTLGFYQSAIDGNFGAGTRKAIKAFQRDYGLVATGYVDGLMLDLLASKATAREQEVAAAQQGAAGASSAAPSDGSRATVTLCNQALATDRSGWEKDERFAASVREAKRRRLSVDDCRVAVGLPRQALQPTAPAEPPANEFAPIIATLQPIDDVFVAMRPAKVRAAPNVTAKVTETLAIGDRIQVLGRLPGQDWYLVARDGIPLGYVVMNQLVSEVDYAKAQTPAEAGAGASVAADQPTTLPPELAALDYGRYYALVIGNSGYRQLPKLRTAVDDAKAVSTLLEQDYGFTISLIVDGTEKSIISEISRLRRTLAPGDNLLIYYAGHGWYDEGAERGYWLPVDAAEDDQSHWISNADITDALKAMRAKHVLVVADSCYSGSLTRGLAIRSGSSLYFTDIVGKRARTALTSGGLEPVLDAGGGGHSVFAKAFLAALQANRGVIDGDGIYHQVYEEVRLNAEQEPGYGNIRLAGHDGGDFLFVRKR